MSLLRNYHVKYYDYNYYCKAMQWYSMRLVCIAGYFLSFSVKQLDLLKAVDIFKLACFKLLYKYKNIKLPIYFNAMFVLQHDNVVIRPRMIHGTPQRFNSMEEILPYNNVCNIKIKPTNSKFCRLCIIYKIPELINDIVSPKIILVKMYTHSYAGFTKN